MTKAEYEAKRKAGLDAGFTPIATAINDMLIKDEYIASLEAENERLTKAVDKAVGIIDGCPTDEYVCPKLLEEETIRSRCDRCIKLYLLGDK